MITATLKDLYDKKPSLHIWDKIMQANGGLDQPADRQAPLAPMVDYLGIGDALEVVQAIVPTLAGVFAMDCAERAAETLNGPHAREVRVVLDHMAQYAPIPGEQRGKELAKRSGLHAAWAVAYLDVSPILAAQSAREACGPDEMAWQVARLKELLS
jgi:hypothetical protein